MARRTIAGSRALVTGASSGIGQALAIELARNGADLVLTARRGERLAELAADLRSLGRRVEYVAGDIAEPATRQAVLDVASQQFGGLDLLINNAGVSAAGRFAEADPSRLRRIFEVNFFAPVELIRAALPTLREGRRPLIVNLGSILSHVGLPDLSEYCASKFALRGFSEALRAELRGQGVDVLVVSPGTVATEIWNAMLEGIPPPRAGRGAAPDVVARRIVRAMERGRRECFPGLPPQAVQLLHRLSPTLVAWFLERRK